jgi:hypothetical protein
MPRLRIARGDRLDRIQRRGVAHHGVEVAEVLEGRVDQVPAVFAVAHVGHDGQRLAQLPQFTKRKRMVSGV